MKKILLIVLLILLTGCGNEPREDFKSGPIYDDAIEESISVVAESIGDTEKQSERDVKKEENFGLQGYEKYSKIMSFNNDNDFVVWMRDYGGKVFENEHYPQYSDYTIKQGIALFHDDKNVKIYELDKGKIDLHYKQIYFDSIDNEIYFTPMAMGEYPLFYLNRYNLDDEKITEFELPVNGKSPVDIVLNNNLFKIVPKFYPNNDDMYIINTATEEIKSKFGN